MYEIRTDYTELRDRIGEELNSASQSFVRIGYLLRIAQDTHILDSSGYANVNEFAKGEFGLEESQTSRFININKRFSDGGYSDRLFPAYQKYGWAKLSIMLTLPDEIVTEISPEYSKAEIQTIASEVKEELTSDKSDLEVRMEDPTAAEWPMYCKSIMQILHEKPELFKAVLTSQSEEDVRAAMIPMGEATYFTRIEGIGKVMVSMNGAGTTFTAVRSGDKETHSWTEIAEEFCDRVTDSGPGDDLETYWQQAYGEEAPEELTGKLEITEIKPKEAPKSLHKKSKEKSEKSTKVHALKKKEEKVEVVEAEEIAPVQTVTDMSKIPPINPPELTYLEKLWQQVHDYGKMIAEETDVKNLRRMIEALTSTCFQIEDEADG